LVADHQKLIKKSSKMILSPKMEAFDLNREPDKMHDAYGRTGTSSIVVVVVGAFRDSCKNHCTIRKSRRVGEAKRNSLDLPKIKRVDGYGRERRGLL